MSADVEKLTTSVKMLDHALAYGRAGFFIFPIHEGTKDQPHIKEWGVNASRDPKQITEWWTRWPNAGIGLACMKSKVAVVDVDVKNGGNGERTLAELDVIEGKQLSPTRMQCTPSGGTHYLYRDPLGAVATTASIIGAHLYRDGEKSHVDTRGVGANNGGYVLLPPSVVAGKPYTWASRGKLALVDPWVADACRVDRGEPVDQDPVVELDQASNIAWAIDYLTNYAPHSIAGRGGEKTLLDVAGILKDHGIREYTAIELLAEHYNVFGRCDPLWSIGEGPDADRLDVKVRNAYAYLVENAPGSATAEADFADDPPEPLTAKQEAEQAAIREKNEVVKDEVRKQRPQVAIVASLIPQAISAAQRALIDEAKRNPKVADRIFQRAGRLVRLNRNLLLEGVQHDKQYRENNALLILDVKTPWLMNRLDQSVEFVGAPVGNPAKLKKDADDKGKKKTKLVPKNAPRDLALKMIESNTQWRFPSLFGTVEAPTLRPDGSVLDAPGYDEETGLFFDPGVTKFPKIKARPTRADGLAAMRMIADLFVDFPFKDAEGYEGVSLAVALAATLTGPVRRTISIAPAFAATAKESQSGKTELCNTIMGVTVGRVVPGRPFSGSEEERRKAIGAALLAGQPVIFFDNADKTPIEGDFLEEVITHPAISDRFLGLTEEYTAPTNALLLFNGNDITIAGEGMATRVLLTRIVPDLPLAKRRFQYPNLFAHVIENRPALIGAVLTALRAFLVAAPPVPDGRDTNRFPQWDRWIAQALVWYDYADPMRGGDEVRDVDPAKEAKRDVVRQWAAIFDDAAVTALGLQRSDEVREAIASARGIKERDVTPMHVGRYAGTLEGVRLDLDWIVRRVKLERGQPAKWWLEYTGDPAMRPARQEPSDVDQDNPFGPGE
jgi:bifunctional DNA primase/polymerase-like protein